MSVPAPPTGDITVNGQLTAPWQAWFAQVSSGGSSAGTYYPTFDAGWIQYAGPNGTFSASIQMIYGNLLPNPTGVIGPCLLLGSGFGAAGKGSGGAFWVITDQAYFPETPGNMLGITAGETQPSGNAKGGRLWLIGGGSFGGTGGDMYVQGGTSLHGPGGVTTVQGGNSTFGPAGDLFLTGGQNGTAGANVHLIMTTLNGTSGVVRIRNNSDILMDFFPDGSIYLYKGGGFGSAGQHITSQGPGQPVKWA